MEWQLQETLEKFALFYEETWKIQKIMKNATLSQGLSFRIVGLSFYKTFTSLRNKQNIPV